MKPAFRFPLSALFVLALCTLHSLLCTSPVSADELSECRRLAPKYQAEVEVRLWDDTPVDLLAKHVAIEVDWTPKWAEAIGQSLYYAQLTDRRPGIILLVKDAKAERHFVYRCQTVCAKYGIQLFVEKSEE
jgi:hypothetical protein